MTVSIYWITALLMAFSLDSQISGWTDVTDNGQLRKGAIAYRQQLMRI
jgi:hypothetical protein